jgi:N6-adenosine-specific RNA methylase IME4
MIINDLSQVTGKYNIIYADPAWSFSNKKTGGSMTGGALNHYPVMSIDDLKALPVNQIAADDCVLIMWWVGAMPQEAIDLVDAWGFKLKNMNGFVWEKLTVKLKMFFGMGYWTRAGSEAAIIAVKGKPKAASHSVRAVSRAMAGAHSKKPSVFRRKAVKLCGDLPRIELFSRQEVKGWDCWGNQIKQLKQAA